MIWCVWLVHCWLVVVAIVCCHMVYLKAHVCAYVRFYSDGNRNGRAADMIKLEKSAKWKIPFYHYKISYATNILHKEWKFERNEWQWCYVMMVMVRVMAVMAVLVIQNGSSGVAGYLKICWWLYDKGVDSGLKNAHYITILCPLDTHIHILCRLNGNF